MLGILHPVGVFCQWCMDLKIYIIYFVFPFAIYFSDILFLHVREPYRKLYAWNHVTSCNGCSHQSNHRVNLFLQFLNYSYRIMRVEGHVNGLYGNIHDCMFNFEMHRINFHNIVQPYTACLCVYGVPYIQVAAIGKICFYNIWHYTAKAFTA